jgi:hypothetical protein
MLENTDAGLRERFVIAYGAEPEALWAGVLRQMRLRLRSIGLAEVADGGGAASGRHRPESPRLAN